MNLIEPGKLWNIILMKRGMHMAENSGRSIWKREWPKRDKKVGKKKKKKRKRKDQTPQEQM